MRTHTHFVVFEYVKDRNRKQITTTMAFMLSSLELCLNMSKIEIESKSQHTGKTYMSLISCV